MRHLIIKYTFLVRKIRLKEKILEDIEFLNSVGFDKEVKLMKKRYRRVCEISLGE